MLSLIPSVTPAAAPAVGPNWPLMPMPAHIAAGSGTLAIDGAFRVAVCGASSAIVDQAVLRFTRDLTAETGLILPDPIAKPDCAAAILRIDDARPIAMPQLGDDESYTLTITAQGARLSAPTSTGIMRGLATFQQLIEPDAHGFRVAAVTIEDRPRFPWRGFMLDASRHWMPLAVVERNLNAIAAVKLNVFHWHLADDQGFRAESRVFPKLQGLGSDGNYYTQEQMRHVVRYAADRGIRVVPEFDIPGHTTSWMVGYPELGSAPGPYQIGRKWGVYEETLDPSRESTYRFLERLIAEMTSLFPDPYFHIGGDEVAPAQWNANPAIQSFMRAHALATPDKLQEYFNKRVEAILIRHNRKMIGWDEILTPDLPATAIIQSWRGQESLAAAARGGHRGLLSSGYYLDHMRPASYHYGNDPLGGAAKNLTPAQAALILGGEACMWTEYVDAETVDSRIWPRLAAVAERFWSPAGVTDPHAMYDRLEAVSVKLQWTGLQHRGAQARLLDRIAGFQGDAALRTLIDAVQAAGIHDRYPAHSYNSLEPLNRLVDAATAESETVRALMADAHAVAAGAATGPEARRLQMTFETWRGLPDAIAAVAAQSFLAGEAVPVAAALSRLGATGLDALGYLQKGQKPDTGWVSAQQAALAATPKLIAEVRPPVEVIAILIAAFSAPTVP